MNRSDTIRPDTTSPVYISFHFQTGGNEPQHPNIGFAAVAVRLRPYHPDPQNPNDLIEVVSTFGSNIVFAESTCLPSYITAAKYNRDMWRATALEQHLVIADFLEWVDPYRSYKPTEYSRYAPALCYHQSVSVPRLKRACKVASVQYPLTHQSLDLAQLTAWSACMESANPHIDTSLTSLGRNMLFSRFGELQTHYDGDDEVGCGITRRHTPLYTALLIPTVAAFRLRFPVTD